MWVNISKFGAVITVGVVEINMDIYLWLVFLQTCLR